MLSEKRVAAIKAKWDKEKTSYEYPIEVEQAFDTCLALYKKVRELEAALRERTEALAGCRCQNPQYRGGSREIPIPVFDCGKCVTCQARLAVAEGKEPGDETDTKRG